MLRRRFVRIASGTALIGLVSGCGGNENNGEQPTTPGEAETANAASAVTARAGGPAGE